VKLKTSGLVFILLGLMGCASLPQDEPIGIYQKTQTYKNHSFDGVWSAALMSVEEAGFVVRNVAKEVGLIKAAAEVNPDPGHRPPVMNVVIREENGRIDVNFHIELPGQRDDSGIRRAYADRFFRALKKNLR
jgi:hypothetical protein